MKIQSILLNKKYFKTRQDAKKYVERLGYKTSIKPDPNPVSLSFYRFRQIQPNRFEGGSLRTKYINAKMRLIVGKLK